MAGEHRAIIDQLLEVELVDAVVVSPDGRHVAYTVLRSGCTSAPDKPAGRRRNQLRVLDIETRSGHSITDTLGSGWGLTWSPDGRRLLFSSDRDGPVALWSWTASDRTVQWVADRQLAPDRWTRGSWSPPIEWSPDGRYAYAAIAVAECVTPKGKASPFNLRVYSSESDDQPVSPPDPLCKIDLATGKWEEVLEELDLGPFRLSPDGSRIVVVSRFRRLSTVDLDQVWLPAAIATPDGADVVWIDGGVPGLEPPSWSPDGHRLAFPVPDGVAFCDAQTGGVKVVALPGMTSTHLCWHPDLPLVAGFSAEEQAVDRQAALWAIPLGGSPTQLRLPPDRTAGKLIVQGDILSTAEDMSCLVATQGVGGSEIWAVPIDGTEPALFHEVAGSIDRWAPYRAPDRRGLVVSIDDEATPPDLWHLSGPGLSKSRRLTDLNPALERLRLGRARAVTWFSQKGDELKGVVLLPPGYAEGEPIPVIVELYPGRGAGAARRWDAGGGILPLQLLVAHGYGVFMPEVITTAPAIPPIEGMAPSVLPGVNELVRLGIADPERLGVLGHSGGGLAVNRIITETTRFRAAVSGAGVADLTSFHGTLIELDGRPYAHGMGMTEAMMGAPPCEHPLDYVLQSPVYWVHRVETPLLLVQGCEDHVTVTQANQMFAELNRLGKRVELLRYEGEGHVPGRFDEPARRDLFERVLAWFDQYL